jgi:peptidoglycan/LPS O-acetylase OafA/YrhL
MEKRIYFKNLAALRFIAATAVIFHHIEQYKFWAKIPNVWGNTTVDAFGSKAVSFFFVLSGFLISYLLMEERRKTGDISIKDFYIRRILRIWPVYYLVVVVVLFVLPHVFDLSWLGIEMYDSKFTLKAVFLLFIVPNLLRIYSPSIVGGNQLWSIGVEEQFYLIWPVLVRWFFRYLIQFLILFVVIKFLITAGLSFISADRGSLVLSAITRFWILLKIEQMAIGAIGAWILFYRKEQILKILYHKLTWLASLLALVFLMTVHMDHWAVNYAEAVVFLLVIMNLSTNPQIRISMEHPVLTKLGNISYGIYMYHTICVTICIYILRSFGVHESNLVLFNVLMYGLSIGLTIAVAQLSYHYFEKRFLDLKERFMIVKSGGEASVKNEPVREQVKS